MLKKIFFLSLFVAATLSAGAVIAFPLPQEAKQSDGSTITVTAHGDEWFHYVTTSDGYTVMKNDNGDFVYANKVDGQLVPSATLAHNPAERGATEVVALATIERGLTPDATESQAMRAERTEALYPDTPQRAYDPDKFRGLVILVNYNDRKFTMDDPNAFFTKMVSEEGFSGYVDTKGDTIECTGSVRDFFTENSLGKFKPEFDVVGPIECGFEQTYVNSTSYAQNLFSTVIANADEQVDFSKYDSDGDGTVDMVFFIVAGGGANYGVNNSSYLWPHASTLASSTRRDGKRMGRYACSVELYGLQANGVVDGIGTICHEFSHVLGLPDLYDTNYATNGFSSTPNRWCVMASGNYLNYSRTPAGYGSYERWTMGWTNPQVITKEATHTLNALQTSGEALRIDATIPNEYFLIENRQKTRWDSALPGHGLLVWRVDSTSSTPWTGNKVNANSTHNYYELIRACRRDTTRSYQNADYVIAYDYDGDPFPGSQNVTSLTNSDNTPNIKSWTGVKTSIELDSIRENSDSTVTFHSVNAPFSSYNEPFDEMPEITADTTGVQGVFTTWSFKGVQVVDVDTILDTPGKAVAFVKGGEIITTTAVEGPCTQISFDITNTSARTSIMRCYYSTNGVTWTSLSTYDNLQMISVGSGLTITAKFQVTNTSPLMFRIYQFSGSSVEETFVDNIEILYEGTSAVASVFSDSKSGLTVSRDGYAITATGVTGTVNLVNAAGTIVATSQATDGTATITAPGPGFYIVTSGSKATKIAL